VIGLPPSGGAVHDTATEPSPGVADTPVGAPGAVSPVGGADDVGVTGGEGVESGLVPAVLVALTRKVYAVPLVRAVKLAVVGAGLPVTVLGVCALVPM
jgi:hypothetical protein